MFGVYIFFCREKKIDYFFIILCIRWIDILWNCRFFKIILNFKIVKIKEDGWRWIKIVILVVIILNGL